MKRGKEEGKKGDGPYPKPKPRPREAGKGVGGVGKSVEREKEQRKNRLHNSFDSRVTAAGRKKSNIRIRVKRDRS